MQATDRATRWSGTQLKAGVAIVAIAGIVTVGFAAVMLTRGDSPEQSTTAPVDQARVMGDKYALLLREASQPHDPPATMPGADTQDTARIIGMKYDQLYRELNSSSSGNSAGTDAAHVTARKYELLYREAYGTED